MTTSATPSPRAPGRGMPRPPSSVLGTNDNRMSDDTLDGVARRLRALRDAYGTAVGLPGISQAAFSKKLGVPITDYMECEGGGIEPSVRLLTALRNRTGVSLDWLITDSV